MGIIGKIVIVLDFECQAGEIHLRTAESPASGAQAQHANSLGEAEVGTAACYACDESHSASITFVDERTGDLGHLVNRCAQGPYGTAGRAPSFHHRHIF